MAQTNFSVSVLAFVSSLTVALHAGELDQSRLLELLEATVLRKYTAGDFQASRQAVIAAMVEIPNEANEDDYFETEAISKALRENALDKEQVPDAEVIGRLENLIAKLELDASPNENPILLNLRQLARRHVLMMVDNDDEDLEANFGRVKIDLGDALRGYDRSLSSQQRIARNIRWLVQHQQGLELVAAARRELSFPNLEVRLPAPLMRELTSRPFRQIDSVNRNSDGIQTRGKTNFSGKGFLKPAHSVGDGALTMQFQGNVLFSATSTRKRIQFRSRATTATLALANVTFDNEGYMTAVAPKVSACTNLQNCPATVQHLFRRKKRGLINCLADRLISRQTPDIEQELSNEVSERVSEELTTQLDELVAEANSFLREKLWASAARLDLKPRVFAVRSTHSELRLSVTEDGQSGLAAPPRLSVDSADGTGSAAIHESLATDLVNSLYVRRKRPRTMDVNSFQYLNDALPMRVFREEELRDETTIEIELDFPRPFVITFENEGINLTLRANQILLGDSTLPGHNVTIIYGTSLLSGGGIQFNLLDKRVSPIDPDAKASADLVKAVHDELLVDLLPTFTLNLEELIPDDVELPVEIRRFVARQGWLVTSIAARQNSKDPSNVNSASNELVTQLEEESPKIPVERVAEVPSEESAVGQLLSMRTWNDATGTYSTVGQIAHVQDDFVRILKQNGRYCTVPLTNLSEHDRRYVEQYAKLLKPKFAQNLPTVRATMDVFTE